MKQNFNLVLPFYSDASLDGWAMNIRGSFFNVNEAQLDERRNGITERQYQAMAEVVGSNPTVGTFTRVLVQNYSPAKIGLNLANNSEVTFTASIAKSDGNDLHLSTIDRDIKLKGETMDTPNGWGNLVIGSQYKR